MSDKIQTPEQLELDLGMEFEKGRKQARDERASRAVRRRTEAPSSETQGNINEVKDAAAGMWSLIDEIVPHSREQSIAKTKLEEAIMWAVKGMTA